MPRCLEVTVHGLTASVRFDLLVGILSRVAALTVSAVLGQPPLRLDLDLSVRSADRTEGEGDGSQKQEGR